MKNRINIKVDELNIYASIEVNASKIGMRILSTLLLIEFLVFVYLFSTTSLDEISQFVVPMIFSLILFVGIPVKYLLWNLYGKEEIIINSKSISWSYDYGFFKTNMETVTFDRLSTNFEHVRQTGNVDIGRLLFINYRAEDNLPEILHQTTALLSKSDIEYFDNQISKIFISEFLDDYGFIPFSNN